MRKVAGLLVLVGMVCSPAMAGIATFTPSSSLVIQGSGEIVTMDVAIAVETLDGFNGVDAVIGSDIPFDFAYSSAVLSSFVNRADPAFNNGIYPFDVLASANNPAAVVGNSILLGTLTIPTQTLAEGVYTFRIDPNTDGFSSLSRGLAGQPFGSEALAGSGSFAVVPEPATLSLLGIGMLGLIRRRFAA